MRQSGGDSWPERRQLLHWREIEGEGADGRKTQIQLPSQKFNNKNQTTLTALIKNQIYYVRVCELLLTGT